MPNCRRWTRLSSSKQQQGRERLFSARNRLPLFLAISIAMFNQLAGINAILYYLNDIFARAGFSKVSSDLQAVAIGATNLLFTMLAMSIIDQVGRRTLMLIGSVGTALCLAGVAAIFWTGTPRRLAGVASDRLHRGLCLFSRLGHLGLHQRSLSRPPCAPTARVWAAPPTGS